MRENDEAHRDIMRIQATLSMPLKLYQALQGYADAQVRYSMKELSRELETRKGEGEMRVPCTLCKRHDGSWVVEWFSANRWSVLGDSSTMYFTIDGVMLQLIQPNHRITPEIQYELVAEAALNALQGGAMIYTVDHSLRVNGKHRITICLFEPCRAKEMYLSLFGSWNLSQPPWVNVLLHKVHIITWIDVDPDGEWKIVTPRAKRIKITPYLYRNIDWVQVPCVTQDRIEAELALIAL